MEHLKAAYNGAWTCIGLHLVHTRINVFNQIWGGIWIQFELVLIWFGEKQAGESRRVSAGASKEWGNHSKLHQQCYQSISPHQSGIKKKEVRAETVHTKSIREQPEHLGYNLSTDDLDSYVFRPFPGSKKTLMMLKTSLYNSHIELFWSIFLEKKKHFQKPYMKKKKTFKNLIWKKKHFFIY